MSQKAIVLICFLFALIVLGMFIFAYLSSSAPSETDAQAISDPDISTQVTPARPTTQESFIPSELVMQKSFTAGTHYLSGVLAVPSGCYSDVAEVMILESYPEQVMIQYSITEVECGTPVDEVSLAIEVTVSPQATFFLSINQTEVPLTLVNQ